MSYTLPHTPYEYSRALLEACNGNIQICPVQKSANIQLEKDYSF